MRAQRRHRPMNQCPTAADSARQQSRVLIFRRHDDAESLKAPEVFGQRQRDSGTAARKRCVRHRILFEFRNVGDARIFDAPDLFRELARIRQQRWLGIDAPSVDSIGGTRGAQMRQAAPVFHAAKQQRISVWQPYSPGVEDAVDRIGPVVPAQDRIAGIAREQGMSAHGSGFRLFQSDSTPVQSSRRSDWIQKETLISWCMFVCAWSLWLACISSRAIRNESVDSAPWFSFTRSG